MTFTESDKEALVTPPPLKIVNKDDRLHWLKDGMPEALTTRLGAYPIFKIIERGQLDQVLNELNLGQSGILDAESDRQLGKILGAGSVLLGSV